jgi:hypothetical protein
MTGKHYALLGAEWTNENFRQLVETTDGGLDYIVSGALRETAGVFEVVLRLWEVKKMRERKVFTAKWSADNADAVLAQLHEQVRMFMEWTPEKSGTPYTVPPHPLAWLGTLGTSLTLFLAGKELLPLEQVVISTQVAESTAKFAGDSDIASLACLQLAREATRRGVVGAPSVDGLRDSPVVAEARKVPA